MLQHVLVTDMSYAVVALAHTLEYCKLTTDLNFQGCLVVAVAIFII